MLKSILKYYFKNEISHYGDCKIYSIRRPLCDCGLLYNLNHIDHALASILYENYEDECVIQETGRNKKLAPKALDFLTNIFGDLNYDKKELYIKYKKILDEYYPDNIEMYARLEKWIL